jgi:Mg-chelatase subunit ChlD
MTKAHARAAAVVLVAFASLEALSSLHAQSASTNPANPDQSDSRFKFKGGVELINVTATVTNASGRFVPGLRKDDFRLFEDDVEQTITHFSADRVPVSLGIVLDTSGSMEGDKIRAARTALERLLTDLNDPDDEFFLYQFADHPTLVQGWTSDRRSVSRALSRMNARGDTTMYDAIARAIPLAAEGRNRKKAVIIISDGNDTSSLTHISDLRQAIRESEVLVYAIGIDGDSSPSRPSTAPPLPPLPPPIPWPVPRPFPPPRRRPLRGPALDQWPQIPRPTYGGRTDRVNDRALREMTDDSGGRTEIVRGARDLEPTTTGIADELSRQYYLGYPAPGSKDGRWHAIRVELRSGTHQVRARRGYVAS